MKKTLMALFADWLHRPLGRELMNEEKQKLSSLLKDKRFNLALLVGDHAAEVMLKDLLVNDYVVVTENQRAKNAVLAKAEFLPVAPNSVDLLVLPHTLDFSRRPHRVVREADHCVRADGVMVVIGFNPVSLWGLRCLFSLRTATPWNGRFQAPWKIKDWLRVLNYKVTDSQQFVYRFPVKDRKVYQKLGWLSGVLRKFLPFSGAVYIIVAKKRVLGVTPLRAKWSKVKKVLNGNGVVGVSPFEKYEKRKELSE